MLNQTISLQTSESTEAPVSIELGAARLDEDSVAQLETGSLVTLDRHADDPVDIVVEGRVVARGELLVIEEELAVRIVELI
ncbi:MAG: FliM/FliN family flagellar motor switch protein [Planctomycetota bacterium]|nr:FliM/FliN family flagellar motor switch protein [Planctomycetota bacterium]MEE3284508.1 FliM/FliN family flagellar motor switch protein [Planctomycetota bacterium]